MANVTTLLKYGLKTNIVKAILFDVLTNASRYYYVFGRSYPWPTIPDTVSGGVISSEAVPPSVIDSYNYELEVRRNSVFLKLIDANDVSIVVERRQWRIGLVYDMYDEYSSSSPSYSGATSLDQANFYVINSDFDVFKCLFNNDNKPSTVQPFLTGDTITPLKLADGYIWKYMYSIPLSLRNKFLNSEYMPVLTSLTSSFYSNGAVSGFSIVDSGKNLVRFRRIKAFNIVNGGSGYTSITVSFPSPSFVLGTQASVTVNLGTLGIQTGVATSVTLVKGSFYLFDPKPTITSTGGTGFDYTIEYEDDTFSGYSVIEISGDGQSAVNAYTIKSVTTTNRGEFAQKIGGSLFNFPNPVDLGTGRKPNLQVNYRPKQTISAVPGTWSFSTEDTSIITITKSNHGISTGVAVTLVFTSGTERPTNDQYTITVVDSNTFTVEAPNDYIPTLNQSGNVSIDVNIKFEIDSVEVVDGGYGYDKPLYSISNSPNTDDVHTVGGVLFTVSATVLSIASLDFNVSTQKNQAVLTPIIGNNLELEHIVIQDPGVGYTQITTTFKSYKRINNDPTEPDEISYVEVQGDDSNSTNSYISDYSPAIVVANISQGNLDTRQSDVEILAVDGSIEVIKVLNSGNGYSSTDQIRVIGDGTGCVAVPVIEDTRIVGVTVTNPGQGYTKAEVKIIGDTRVSVNKATFEAIISPKGGHGKDAIDELFARTIAFYTKLVGNEKNQGLEVDNDYRQISILKNPLKYALTEYYRNATGSGCVLATVDNTNDNQQTFNLLPDNAILRVDTTITQYQFVLVHKEGPTDNKYKLLLKPIDNYIPSPGQSLIYTYENTEYAISASEILTPNFNKFSGEMLYIDNRVAFTPSQEQAITITTLISF
jgi:hypothetical protein